MADSPRLSREKTAMTRLPIVLCIIFFTDVPERESQKFGIRAVVDKSNAGTQLVGVVEEVLEEVLNN